MFAALARRSSVVLCKAVIADRTGVVASRWCLELRNRTQPCVFSHKVAPGIDVGNLVCATGASFVRFRFALGRLLHRKVEFKGADRSGMAASVWLSKGEWHHQTRMSRARNVKDKEVQEITKPTAIQGVSPRSNRLFLVFIAFSPSRNFRHPVCPGSTCSHSRRKLEVKLPTIWTNEKQRWEESEKRRQEERRSRCAKRQESRETLCFPMICGSGGSKSRLAKAAGAEPAGQMRDEKLHAVVARSTCASEKAENIVRWAHFWKLRCLKSARRCGAKHISKSTCKHEGFGPLLEVQMSFRVAGARDCAPCQK